MKRSEINKLDELWAQIVKDKANWTCEHCRVRGVRMEAAHVVGRRYRATRWGCYRIVISKTCYDLCGHCLCHNCHQQYDEHGPLEHNIIERTIGESRKLRIQRTALQTVVKYQEFEDVKQDLLAVVNDSPRDSSLLLINKRGKDEED